MNREQRKHFKDRLEAAARRAHAAVVYPRMPDDIRAMKQRVSEWELQAANDVDTQRYHIREEVKKMEEAMLWKDAAAALTALQEFESRFPSVGPKPLPPVPDEFQ